MHLFQKFEHDVEVRWRRWSEHYLNSNRKGILFEESSISKKESFQSFYASFLGMNIVTSWFNVEVSFFLVLRFSYGKYPVDTSTEGLQLVVRKEELEQSTGEHSPGVSLPGNSGLLSTFQDIRCFYHWNCSLDDLEKWCGNCRNDGSSLRVLYVCVATGTKIQTTSLLLSTCLRTAICLPEASNWEHSKFFTFWKISLSRCLRCIVCVCVCVFWWILKGSIFALSMCHPFSILTA